MAAASGPNLSELFRKQVALQAEAPALIEGEVVVSYRELEATVAAWVQRLAGCGLHRGQRLAIWSENRRAYVEIQLAAAQLGVMVACLNWRLNAAEQRHCIGLVAPSLIVVSARYREQLDNLDHGVEQVVDLDAPAGDPADSGRDAEAGAVAGPDPKVIAGTQVDPEDGFLILYTSGTTGLPKGAVISQRATVARAQVFAADFGIGPHQGFIAWSPFFHMAATDHALATLLIGGRVIIQDGFSASAICQALGQGPISWLMAMPGVIEPLIEALRDGPPAFCDVRMVGAMADLVPPHQLAELTALVGAPYLNTFGSTETGLAPASAALLAAGRPPGSLAKRESGWCAVRLVDDEGLAVANGIPGHIEVRGPSLFSGYWVDGGIDDGALASGWFRMGDLFIRHDDGSLDFVDRSKYLIKSGGENVYPAEVERVLLAHPDVIEAVVVRRPDSRWGEVPVAVVATDPDRPVSAEDLLTHCRAALASYKLPRRIHFVDPADFPRNSTGKILKRSVEAMLDTEDAPD